MFEENFCIKRIRELMEKNGFYANLYNSQFEQAGESA